MATVICHFYNEEYLLPWWLEHHRKIFSHGIMIDYHSTDNSVNLIKQYCPTWDIVTTRNQYFDSAIIDREVEYYEHQCQGWRMALNVTEFLYGNLDVFKQDTPNQHILSNFVFIDPLQGQEYTHKKPLHEQCYWGYHETNPQSTHFLNRGYRAGRSIHNYNIEYPEHGGRHFNNVATLKSLAIFYYGYAIQNEEVLARKLQIKSKISPKELKICQQNHPNTLTANAYLNNIERWHRPRCSDLSLVIEPFVNQHYDQYHL